MNLSVFPSEADWFGAAKRAFVDAAADLRARASSAANICLSGGSTPLGVYRHLARDTECALAFSGLKVNLWLGDERIVPAGSPDSNSAAIVSAWSGCVWKPAPLIKRWPPVEGTEADLAAAALEACHAYSADLAEALGPGASFDLVILGLGADGHTASLFPGDPILEESARLAAPSTSPMPPRFRMSLTYPAFSRAKQIVFLVRGGGKKAVVEALVRGDPSLPASRICGDSSILYCLAE